MPFAHNKQAINFKFSRQGRWEVLANVLYLMKLGHVTNRTSILQNLVYHWNLSLQKTNRRSVVGNLHAIPVRNIATGHFNTPEPRFAAHTLVVTNQTPFWKRFRFGMLKFIASLNLQREEQI